MRVNHLASLPVSYYHFQNSKTTQFDSDVFFSKFCIGYGVEAHFTLQLLTYTHTHTHIRLMALFPGLPGRASTRKVKLIWISLKQETVSGSGINWAICKLLTYWYHYDHSSELEMIVICSGSHFHK